MAANVAVAMAANVTVAMAANVAVAMAANVAVNMAVAMNVAVNVTLLYIMLLYVPPLLHLHCIKDKHVRLNEPLFHMY